MLRSTKIFLSVAAVAASAAFPAVSHAATVSVDGANYTTLSAAVDFVQAQDDGPHTINITVDVLPTADGEIVINEPMTINGDADANGTKCDILVDVASIQNSAYVSEGLPEKCYIEIQSPGDVIINDLKIHPNADGLDTTAERVDGIRMNRPVDAGTSNYTLNRVWVSGSDASNAYVDLQTPDDVYDSVATKKWSTQGDGGSHAVIQLTKGPDTALGLYNANLNNCHAGLGKGPALSIPAEDGFITVNGGLYGHAGEDGIRITGTTVTLTGSATNRLRVVRVPCVSGGNAHGVELESNAHVALIEYVDVATINTGYNFKGQGTPVCEEMRFCRGLGKFTDTNNPGNYLHNNPTFMNVHDCTFVGSGGNPDVLHTRGDYDGEFFATDSIFTSENLGDIQDNSTQGVGVLSFTNCALPTDGTTSESLATPPIAINTSVVTENNTISVSPMYALTRDDYDWSDEQGASDPLNGPGNANVLRPTNVAYFTASSTAGPLTGGAGPDASGIDAGTWMLME